MANRLTQSTTSVAMFYFSGTGNTEVIADLLSREFERSGCRVKTTFINKALIETLTQQGRFDSDGYDLVGIGYPVHAFNAPRIVLDFIDHLPVAQGQPTFVFKDPGDPMGNGGSTHIVRRKLRRRGYDVFHEALFVMPSNVLVRYDNRLVKQLYNKAVEMARATAAAVLSGQRNLQRNGPLLRAFTWGFSTAESWGARFFGKHIRVSEACTLCGTCARECPMGNISIVDGGGTAAARVRFGWNCVLCMHCVYRCPVGAISPRGFMFLVLDDGTGCPNPCDIQGVVANPSVPGDFVSKETKGYFASFREYLES
jgi:ferredoxin/flavodoxin